MVAFADVVAVAGTYLVLAAFLSLTAFLAGRNVLGDVRVERALLVGPVPAAASVLEGVGVFPLVTAGLAVALDLATIRWAYDLEWRTAGYVTFIHVIVSILLAVLLVSAFLLVYGTLVGTVPG